MFLGDSITQGEEYFNFIEYYLDKQYPAQRFDGIRIGLSSESVSGLSENADPFPRPWLHERLCGRAACHEAGHRVRVLRHDPRHLPPAEAGASWRTFQNGISKFIAHDKAAGARTSLVSAPTVRPGCRSVCSVRPAGAADFGYMNPFDEVRHGAGRLRDLASSALPAVRRAGNRPARAPLERTSPPSVLTDP